MAFEQYEGFWFCGLLLAKVCVCVIATLKVEVSVRVRVWRRGIVAWASVATWVTHSATCHIMSNLDGVKGINPN